MIVTKVIVICFVISVLTLFGISCQTSFGQITDNPNMTNFETLFEKPEYQLCREITDYGDQGPLNPDGSVSDNITTKDVCDVDILNVIHETNNTLFVSVSNPSFMGPVLDAIYDQDFKIESIIPDTYQSGEFNTWIYFRK